MILGVPIPLYDPSQDQQELKVISEVNIEARERRRSGLKEESRLPPIRPKYSSRNPPQLETEEKKESEEKVSHLSKIIGLSMYQYF